MANIKVFSLGGQDERWKSCHVIEVDNDVYIINAGLKTPLFGELGVSSILPDYSVLTKYANRIKGIFIGQAAYENFGGLPYLFGHIKNNTPIFTSKMGQTIITSHFTKTRRKFIEPSTLNIKPVEALKEIPLGNVTVIPFHITNNVSDSYGWVFKTKDGSIVYLDDFFVNNDRLPRFSSQLNLINTLTKFNTLLLLPSLGFVGNNTGWTSPNYKVRDFYQTILRENQGKVVISITDHDMYTIGAIISLSKEMNRPFSIYSPAFLDIFNAMVARGHFGSKHPMSIKLSQINQSPNAIVIVSATRDELYKTTKSILDGSVDAIKLGENDAFVLGSYIYPGYEMQRAKLGDYAAKLDINNYSLPKTIYPMQASNEDHKFLISLLAPKYVMPVNGLYKSMINYERIAKHTYLKENQIIKSENGEIISFVDGELVTKEKNDIIHLTEQYVGSTSSSSIAKSILYERNEMAENGVVVLILPFDSTQKKIIDAIKISSYGVIKKDNLTANKLKEITDIINKDIANCIIIDNRGRINTAETHKALKKLVGKVFEKNFDKRPLMLPCIIDVTNSKNRKNTVQLNDTFFDELEEEIPNNKEECIEVCEIE